MSNLKKLKILVEFRVEIEKRREEKMSLGFEGEKREVQAGL